MTEQVEKTPHVFSIHPGYDPASYCKHCGASDYDTATKTCEDYHEEVRVKQEKATRTHAATEAAWEKARRVLTEEEWELLGMQRYPNGRPYRERDYIRV